MKSEQKTKKTSCYTIYKQKTKRNKKQKETKNKKKQKTKRNKKQKKLNIVNFLMPCI